MEITYRTCVLNNSKYNFRLEEYEERLTDNKIKYFPLIKPFNNGSERCVLSVLVEMGQIDQERAKYIMYSTPDMKATPMKLLFDVAIEDKNIYMWGAFYTALHIVEYKLIEDLDKSYDNYGIPLILHDLRGVLNPNMTSQNNETFSRSLNQSASINNARETYGTPGSFTFGYGLQPPQSAVVSSNGTNLTHGIPCGFAFGTGPQPLQQQQLLPQPSQQSTLFGSGLKSNVKTGLFGSINK